MMMVRMDRRSPPPLVLPSSPNTTNRTPSSLSSSSSSVFSSRSVTLLPSPRNAPEPRNVTAMLTYTVSAVGVMAFILYYARNLFYFLEYVKSLGLFGNLIMIISYIPTGLPFAIMSYYIPISLSIGFMYGYYLGFATCCIGSLVSSLFGFFITRRFCRSWLEQRINENRRIGGIVKAILDGHGFKLTLLSRFLPLPFGLQNGLCAMTNISPTMFTIASFIGLMPENILLIYFGYSFDSIGELARGNFGEVSIYQKILLVTAILGGIGLIYFGRRFITTTIDTTGYSEVPNRDEFLNVSMADMEEGNHPDTDILSNRADEEEEEEGEREEEDRGLIEKDSSIEEGEDEISSEDEEEACTDDDNDKTNNNTTSLDISSSSIPKTTTTTTTTTTSSSSPLSPTNRCRVRALSSLSSPALTTLDHQRHQHQQQQQQQIMKVTVISTSAATISDTLGLFPDGNYKNDHVITFSAQPRMDDNSVVVVSSKLSRSQSEKLPKSLFFAKSQKVL